MAVASVTKFCRLPTLFILTTALNPRDEGRNERENLISLHVFSLCSHLPSHLPSNLSLSGGSFFFPSCKLHASLLLLQTHPGFFFFFHSLFSLSSSCHFSLSCCLTSLFLSLALERTSFHVS